MQGNITFKELTLNAKKVEQLADIIDEELKGCIDTQIFVDKDFLAEIKQNNFEHHILLLNHANASFHYRDGSEIKYGFYKDSEYSNLRAMIHFVLNCFGYYQITFFSSNKIDEYIHYFQGMKQIIIMHAEK